MIANCIIIGSQKAGTTSLFNYLAKQEHVFGPRIKECDFFSNFANEALRENLKYAGKQDAGFTLGQYEALYMNAADSAVRLDASPSYMWCDGVPEMIQRYSPDALIVGIIREPISRIRSAYKHNIRRGLEDILDINEAIMAEERRWQSGDYKLTHLYCRRSEYLSQLKRYYSLFGADRVKVFTFDEFVGSPGAVVGSILQAYSLDITDEQCLKESYNSASASVGLLRQVKARVRAMLEPKVPVANYDMKPEVIDYIREQTNPHFEELSALTGCDLLSWK